MYSLLLIIIYISFISLGLPDTLLGSAWPSMYHNLNVPVSYAGIISMIIAGGTILSSLYSYKLIQKIGTGKVTAISVMMTAFALFGFSISNSFILLCLWAIPYGLGAGSVDAALNNFVALHYKSRHMSWLHCFWGIGATTGPYIMGYMLAGGRGWNSGYRFISIFQILLTAVLVFSLPLWKKINTGETEKTSKHISLTMKELIKLPGAKPALTAFFCYAAFELTTGLWGASYMVINRSMSPEKAAKWASLFYLGITCGRFISGFVTFKLSDRNMVRIGEGLALIGVILLLLPFGNTLMCFGFIMIGIGCAPIYPSLLHQTPEFFGADLSQAVMGMQMACAYIGSTFIPPLFGLIADKFNILWYPLFLLVFLVIMIVLVEKMNHTKHPQSQNMKD